jgi:hypothetical protein
LSSDDEWKEDEEWTLSQKIIKKVKSILFPSRKPREQRGKRIKRKNRNFDDVVIDISSVKQPVEQVVKQPVVETKVEPKPEPELKSEKSRKPKQEEKWDEDKPQKARFIPNLDRTFPGPMVVKRLIATVLLLCFTGLLIFVLRDSPIPAIICFLTMIIFIDYLIITGPQKTEKWAD